MEEIGDNFFLNLPQFIERLRLSFQGMVLSVSSTNQKLVDIVSDLHPPKFPHEPLDPIPLLSFVFRPKF
jgi:hypothetical protein